MTDLVNQMGRAAEEAMALAHRRNNPAGFMHERIMGVIAAQQDRLSNEYELGVQVIGGAAPPFHLRDIRYSNPDILIFIGKDDDGKIVQLMQHHTQMSVMLVAVPKLEEAPYRIGFTAK
ncbi:hypothetical protein EPK84_17605 [Sinorhizobium fredii]|nr:hypothetical protein EPK84_17605 [Sinorhizobium fredii]